MSLQVNPFNQIPDEINTLIFSQLDAKSRFNCSQVDLRFHKLANIVLKQDEFWHKLYPKFFDNPNHIRGLRTMGISAIECLRESTVSSLYLLIDRIKKFADKVQANQRGYFEVIDTENNVCFKINFCYRKDNLNNPADLKERYFCLTQFFTFNVLWDMSKPITGLWDMKFNLIFNVYAKHNICKRDVEKIASILMQRKQQLDNQEYWSMCISRLTSRAVLGVKSVAVLGLITLYQYVLTQVKPKASIMFATWIREKFNFRINNIFDINH